MSPLRISRISLLAAVAVLLASCGTLPVKTNDKSIVIIKILNNENDFEKYYVYFRLYYSKNDFIRIDPTKERSISINFEPGDYEITAIEPVYYQMNRPYKRTETSISFSCAPNGITILKDAIKISFEYGDSGYLSEHAEFSTLSDEEYNKLVDSIKKDGNAKYWDIAVD